ncbi:hypothetical protein [Kitasatospora cineracea]|uniref:hypothetical protein n=1 Tax=Kitasatospora cineracea TaxID=88074 RepID=UPI00369FC620
MLPVLASRTVKGRTVLALDYTPLFDPLIRSIAADRADFEQVDKDLDHIADLTSAAKRIVDADEREPVAAELDFRVEQFLDTLGHASYELPSEPRPWALASARLLACRLRGMADRISEWADVLAAQSDPEPESIAQPGGEPEPAAA